MYVCMYVYISDMYTCVCVVLDVCVCVCMVGTLHCTIMNLISKYKRDSNMMYYMRCVFDINQRFV